MRKFVAVTMSLLLIALAGCQPVQRLDSPGANEPAVMQNIVDYSGLCKPPAESIQASAAKLASGEWVDGQLLVFGAEEDISSALESVTQTLGPLDLRLIYSCSLQPLLETEAFQTAVSQLTGINPLQWQRGSLQKRLYQVSSTLGEQTDLLEQIVVELNRQHEPTLGQERRLVYADPNYLVGASSVTSCADPHTIGDGPFELQGASSAGGASHAGPAAVQVGGEANAFLNQWALTRFTASLLDNVQKASNNGKGARVVIFDTSPFTDMGPGKSGQIQIDWAQPTPLTMSVTYPTMATVLTPGIPPIPTSKEHGLFVAGLVHAVAPDSEINLVRVLDDTGCGDLNTLSDALFNMLYATLLGGDKSPTVINLSLGVRPSAKLSGVLDEVFLLMLPLLVADAADFVVVAAAGNESSLGNGVQPSLAPGSYPKALGVAASDTQGNPTCYSNQGDVAAPGGNGGPATVNSKNHSCAPLAHLCPGTNGNCEYGVMSLVQRVPSQPDGYAYWSGTSFATPLVAGLAVLIRAKDTTLSDEDVVTIIQHNATPATPNAAPEVNGACAILQGAQRPATCP